MQLHVSGAAHTPFSPPQPKGQTCDETKKDVQQNSGRRHTSTNLRGTKMRHEQRVLTGSPQSKGPLGSTNWWDHRWSHSQVWLLTHSPGINHLELRKRWTLFLETSYTPSFWHSQMGMEQSYPSHSPRLHSHTSGNTHSPCKMSPQVCLKIENKK